jgi:hypothetical protein
MGEVCLAEGDQLVRWVFDLQSRQRERHRVLLEEEGISFRADGTIDLNRYPWRPGLEIIKKLSLPEEIAFQINLEIDHDPR